jgi:preprotein translocase subunit SecD
VFDPTRPGHARARLRAAVIAGALVAGAGALARAQSDFATEIRLAIDTGRIPSDQIRRADEARLEEALRARLTLFTPRGEGSVKLESPSNIRMRVPLERVAAEQLTALARTGYLEIRHFRDLRSSANSDGRYELNYLNIQGARQQERQLRFYDRRENKLVPLKEFLARCPLVVTSADVLPGGANVVSGSLFLAVRVPFKPAATRRLESFFKRQGEVLGVILDGEPISITTTVRAETVAPKPAPGSPKPLRETPKERKEREEREEREVPQLDVTGGFSTAAEAGYLAAVFNAGPLPLPVKVIESRLIAGER